MRIEHCRLIASSAARTGEFGPYRQLTFSLESVGARDSRLIWTTRRVRKDRAELVLGELYDLIGTVRQHELKGSVLITTLSRVRYSPCRQLTLF